MSIAATAQEDTFLFTFVLPAGWTEQDTGIGLVSFNHLISIAGGKRIIRAWMRISKEHVTPGGKVILGFTAEEALQALEDIGICPVNAFMFFFEHLNICPI